MCWNGAKQHKQHMAVTEFWVLSSGSVAVRAHIIYRPIIAPLQLIYKNQSVRRIRDALILSSIRCSPLQGMSEYDDTGASDSNNNKNTTGVVKDDFL